MARIQINDLQVPEKELTEKEMSEVAGGAIQYRRWQAQRYVTRYRYVKRVTMQRVAYRVRQVQTNVSAFGTNYGSWQG